MTGAPQRTALTPEQERAALARIAQKWPDQRFEYGAKELDEFISACEQAEYRRGFKEGETYGRIPF